MRAFLTPLLTVALFISLLPTIATGGTALICEDPLPPLQFDDKVFIDTDRSGGEPVAITAQDGSIQVSSHAGTTHFQPAANALAGTPDFAVGYYNQTLNWRSTDGGRSWEYIGLAGLNEGPHSLTSTGFSDPDYAMDQAGTIYNVEIDLVNNAVFSSRDDGQSYLLANPQVFPGDRPWLVANEPDEVFLYVNLPKAFLRSTDGGITWGLLPTPPFDDKPMTDPLNPDDGIIGPHAGGNAISISGDDGQTWTTYPTQRPHGTTGPFVNVAVDRSGNAYVPLATGYQSGDQADGKVSIMAFNREDETWTNTSFDLEEQLGYSHDAQWPWAIAGDDGRVAMTWLGTGPDPATGEHSSRHLYLYAAYSLNALGTDCDGDGDIDDPAQWSVANASVDPIHVGQLCTGTGCNVNGFGTDKQADRRLGDFHSIQIDHTGRMFIVSGDTTRPSITNEQKPVSNPIFVGAAGDVPLLLEQPDDIRPSRCLEPLGATPLCKAQ